MTLKMDDAKNVNVISEYVIKHVAPKAVTPNVLTKFNMYLPRSLNNDNKLITILQEMISWAQGQLLYYTRTPEGIRYPSNLIKERIIAPESDY